MSEIKQVNLKQSSRRMQRRKQQLNKLSNAQLEKLLLDDLLKVKQGKKKNKNSSNKKAQRRTNIQRPNGPNFSGGAAVNYSKNLRATAPNVKASNNSCRIKHREFIGNVFSSETFSTTLYPINPGMSETFPWLSIMARGWERYKFHHLKFVLHTRSSTSAPGSIIMAPDYDSTDVAPQSETVMSAYKDAVEGPPWRDQACTLSPRDMYNAVGEHFIRSTEIIGQSEKLYDVASFIVAALDAEADSETVVWSKLWVEYDVSLIIPQLPPSGSTGGLVAGGTIYGGNAGQAPTTPFGTNPTIDFQTLGISVSEDGGSLYFSAEYFPSNVSVVVCIIAAGSTTGTWPNTTQPIVASSPNITNKNWDTVNSVVSSVAWSNGRLKFSLGLLSEVASENWVSFSYANIFSTVASGIECNVSICPEGSLVLNRTQNHLNSLTNKPRSRNYGTGRDGFNLKYVKSLTDSKAVKPRNGKTKAFYEKLDSELSDLEKYFELTEEEVGIIKSFRKENRDHCD